LYGYGNIAEDWYLKPNLYYLKQGMINESEALLCLGSSMTLDRGSPNRTIEILMRQLAIQTAAAT